jgi:DNA primase
MVEELKEYLKINAFTAKHYVENIKRNKFILDTVLKRIPKETMEYFRLGVSRNNSLVSFLKENNLDLKKAEQLGLIKKNNADGTYYEFFRSRITIPIISSGVIVGFSGRRINENIQPKYLNSDTSFLYDKSCTLYGLWQCLDTILEKRTVILVEGYFDMLTLYSYGINNVVALCGTSLSSYQKTLLTTVADCVYILLDGDKAGRDAAKKISKTLKNSKLISIPSGDPDEYIKENGIDAFKTLLELP